MARIPEAKAMAAANPAPPLGAGCAGVSLSNGSNSTGNTPRPRVRVSKEDVASICPGVAALSRNQIAASRVLQQYAQRGIIRVASTDAGSHRAETTKNASNSTSKRRCTGKGVNTPSARNIYQGNSDIVTNFKRNCDDLSDGPRKCGRLSSVCLASSSLPRPPEGNGR